MKVEIKYKEITKNLNRYIKYKMLNKQDNIRGPRSVIIAQLI